MPRIQLQIILTVLHTFRPDFITDRCEMTAYKFIYKYNLYVLF